eukprot:tig00000145_g8860.t1
MSGRGPKLTEGAPQNAAGARVAAGRYPEAEEALQAGLADARGDFGRAEGLYKARPTRALGIFAQSVGEGHPFFAAAANNAGLHFHARGRLSEAEQMLSRALAAREAALGPEHASVGGALSNLAMVLEAQGRLEEATHLYRARPRPPAPPPLPAPSHGRRQRAVAVDEAALGPGHPDAAATLNNLAMLLHRQERLGEAEGLYRRALGVYERSLGSDHPQASPGPGKFKFR